MRKPTPATLALLIAVPLLVAAAVVLAGRGDDPVADTDRPVPGQTGTRAGTVLGVVTGADGRPVSGALVQPTSLDDPAQPVPEMGVLTGPQGRYEWQLRPGTYRFTVRIDGRDRASGTGTVIAARTTTVDLTVS